MIKYIARRFRGVGRQRKILIFSFLYFRHNTFEWHEENGGNDDSETLSSGTKLLGDSDTIELWFHWTMIVLAIIYSFWTYNSPLHVINYAGHTLVVHLYMCVYVNYCNFI